MNAEQIVRALAAANPLTNDRPEGPSHCVLCDGPSDGRCVDHEPDCPWRLAVEWVAADRERAALYDRFGPQFKLPAGVALDQACIDDVWIQLAESVTGPGEFYFDADTSRLLPYPTRP